MSRAEKERVELLSQSLSRLGKVVAALLIGALGVGLAIAVLVEQTESPGADTTTATTALRDPVPVYDVNRDGDVDFAVIQDEVVAVPDKTDSSGLPVWLPVVGTVVAAGLGAGATFGVAMLNRDGGRKLNDLATRIDALESHAD